jgi:hypothetical protein
MFSTETFFSETLPQRLEAQPVLGTKLNAVVQFTLEDVKTEWTVDASSSPVKIERGLHGVPRCRLILSEGTLLDVIEGRRTLKQAFTQGDLRIAGDPTFGVNLGMLLRR